MCTIHFIACVCCATEHNSVVVDAIATAAATAPYAFANVEIETASLSWKWLSYTYIMYIQKIFIWICRYSITLFRLHPYFYDILTLFLSWLVNLENVRGKNRFRWT